MFVRACMHAHTYSWVPPHTCGSQRTTCGSQLSPSNMSFMGIKLRLASLQPAPSPDAPSCLPSPQFRVWVVYSRDVTTKAVEKARHGFGKRYPWWWSWVLDSLCLIWNPLATSSGPFPQRFAHSCVLILNCPRSIYIFNCSSFSF